MDQKRIKVVWLCHFTNNHVQDILKPRKRMMEFAPWISFGIQEAKKRNDLELHIVSPHRWIGKTIEFVDENIYYHFFNPGIPYYGRHWPRFFRFDIYTNFKSNKRNVNQFINNIKPDLIHLHGLENAYYSSTVLQFIEKYPIIGTIQGFTNLSLPRGKFDKVRRTNNLIEITLLMSLKNFGIRTEAMKKEIIKYNPEAIFYWNETFMNIPKGIKEPEIKKKYDLIFFAKVTKDKGVEDLIKITCILKEIFSNIKVAIIGTVSKIYFKKIERLLIDFKCQNNIIFLGFIPQESIYKILANSKISVLPTYNDSIPGTIIESMFRKIPVVSYKTGGIPDINKEEENILLAEQGDIKSMADLIQKLLENKHLRKKMADLAYSYAVKRWDNKNALNDIIHAYEKILNN